MTQKEARVLGRSSAHETRLDRLVNHVIYRIATGKWEEGRKLPSVREAERRWGVDRRVVLEGYRRLARLRLVRCVDRSGYFVESGIVLDRVSRHRHGLERMFEAMSTQIIAQTGLSPLAVFRYLASLAEIKARAAPECAFAECTGTQASGHAAEIETRLGIPCAALVTSHLAEGADRVPASVRLVVVSAFHAAQLDPLRKSDSFEILSVPIELAPGIADAHPSLPEAILVERLDREAENIQQDLARLLPNTRVRRHSTEDPEGYLEQLTDSGALDPRARVAFLSPRVWGQVGSQWRRMPGIEEARFQIVEAAWPRIADAIGLPLGEFGA